MSANLSSPEITTTASKASTVDATNEYLRQNALPYENRSNKFLELERAACQENGVPIVIIPDSSEYQVSSRVGNDDSGHILDTISNGSGDLDNLLRQQQTITTKVIDTRRVLNKLLEEQSNIQLSITKAQIAAIRNPPRVLSGDEVLSEYLIKNSRITEDDY